MECFQQLFFVHYGRNLLRINGSVALAYDQSKIWGLITSLVGQFGDV
jgi:hypothetical protein